MDRERCAKAQNAKLEATPPSFFTDVKRSDFASMLKDTFKFSDIQTHEVHPRPENQ